MPLLADPQRCSPARRWGPLVVLALLLHAAGTLVADRLLPEIAPGPGASPPISLVVLDPVEEEAPAPEEPEDEPTPLEDGQLVETARPVEQERPEEADYLAEHDQTVEEQTRVDDFVVNPEVLAPVPSEDQRVEIEDLADLDDLDMEDPSTGAQVGNERFDPSRDGTMAALPSPFQVTNKEGMQAPVPVAHEESVLSGAVQNDLIDEKRGDALQLNTKEVLYASYLMRIRRLVNFYWEQNVKNVSRSLRISKPRYTTEVEVVLTREGDIERIEISEAAGLQPLDEALIEAYHLAGPFPNPPEQLIDADDRVVLPPMRWTVTFGVARNQYQGIDPNAGNQFPGILRVPR